MNLEAEAQWSSSDTAQTGKAETVETPRHAARRLSQYMIDKGFRPQALHCYCSPEGAPLYWRIRLKHPTTGEKWIRPMFWDGRAFVLREPPFPSGGKPLYGLDNLAAASPDAPIYVVEGEACVDVLWALGVRATTSGASNTAAAADWTPLAGRHSVIWRDNDDPGLQYAEAVTKALLAQGCEVEWISEDVVSALPAGGDVVDWLRGKTDATAFDLHGLPRTEPVPQAPAAPATPAVVRLSAQGVPRDAPEPLRRPVPPPRAYPVEALGEELEPVCRAIQHVIQAPDAICAGSLLAVASLCVQGHADVVIDGRRIPLSLWLLTVADSGERKSAVDTIAMHEAREVEREMLDRYQADLLAFGNRNVEWETQRGVAVAAARKGEASDLRGSLDALGPPPCPPAQPLLTVADFTAEGVAKLLMHGRPSIGAFTDEAALVFGGHAMSEQAVQRTAGAMSRLWDGGSLDRVRSTDGAVKLYGKRLALHPMAQPIVVERVLSNEILAGQGFLARCLLAWPDGTAGHRPYVSEDLLGNAAVVRYGARVRELLELPLPLRNDDLGRNELEPRELPLSPQAKQAWTELYNSIEKLEAPGCAYSGCKPWASKAAEQILRIAGVLTLFHDIDAGEIGDGAIVSAGTLVDWYVGEAARLAGVAETSPGIRDAEAILAWCREQQIGLLHSRRALQYGPSRIRDRARFMAAMEQLESAGWAAYVEGGMAFDGRHRRHVWRMVIEPAEAPSA